MARTPSDATRFTATGPYASDGASFTSNPSTTSGSRISFNTPVPENESPQQKIARLRAAATAARRGHETQFDKVVRVGRSVADRAHRFTALGLIGLTVLSAMVATAGVTDMLVHNRRRRNEWLAEQQAKTKRDLKEAFAARERGTATDDQMLLINRERAAAEAAELRKNRPGVFKRTTNWLFGGLSAEEQRGGRLGVGGGDTLALSQAAKELQENTASGTTMHSMTQKLEQESRSGEFVEEVLRPQGGPLDREAQRAANAAANISKSWVSWITGSK